MSDPQGVTVIGAGISGLACAYRLQQMGIAANFVESSDRAGGVIEAENTEGFLFESGPQSFQGSEQLLKLIRELGLESELQFADSRAPRYIVRDKRLRKLPTSPPALVASTFLGIRSRWNLLSEPLKQTKPPSEDESVASFVRRKFGSEILDYVVAPFVSGVYAGDPEQLSLRAAFPDLDQWERDFGSVVRGAIKSRPAGRNKSAKPSLFSFRGGVAVLPRAMAESLGENLHTRNAATSVHRTNRSGGSAFEVELTRNGAIQRNSAAAIVMATPAYTASELLRAISPSLSKALSSIAYAPVAVVAAAYKREQVSDPLYGFGFLVPRKEKIRTLGTVWNSSLFPDRGPQGTVVMTSFIGGATDLDVVGHAETEIAQIVNRDNAALLGIAGFPIATKVWKCSRALPQYNLRHGHVIEAIREGERASSGIFLAGNYLEGPSMGKCIENGFRTAESVATYMSKSG